MPRVRDHDGLWAIRLNADTTSRKIGPEDTCAIHKDRLDWLTRAMAKPWNGQRIIASCDATCRAAVLRMNGLSAAFASDLGGRITKHSLSYWFYGQTHRQIAAKMHVSP